ncbi:hypothetical protein ABT236_24600 [Streptomyces sp. NPDC001523]|uniref:hypothetical protein n=1 Tax=Streptomyces sp. NPDC001523 TaxID=3154383 RepID=UPI00332FF62E
MREKAGDREAAETLAQEATSRGNTDLLDRYHQLQMRQQAGDREDTEPLAQRSVYRGTNKIAPFRFNQPSIVTWLWPYGLDPDGTPTPPW